MKKIKGVILAGGTGSRLAPLTRVTNKHLLPVGKIPMIIHSIKKLVEAEIKEIIVITGIEHMGDMISLLGSGSEYNCELTYRVQDKPDGIAGALALCKNFCGSDDLCVVLGDNVFEDELAESKKKFESINEKVKCVLNLKKVNDPERFGVPEIIGDKILQIEEKPKLPKSSYCVTGIYFYDKKVFEFIEDLKKSARGEYEITDVNNKYIKEGVAKYNILSGWWADAGTHESYSQANMLVNKYLT